MTEGREYQLMRHPAFQRLSTERLAMTLCLAALIGFVYFGFIFCATFRPDLLGRPLSDNTVISVGILAGLAVIASGVAITGVYIVWANSRFDRLLLEVMDATK